MYRALRQVVGRDAIADVPHDGDTRDTAGEAAVEGRLQRVRVHKIGFQRAEPSCEPERVRGQREKRARIDPAGSDRRLPHVAEPRVDSEHLRRDPELLESLAEGAVLAEDDVGVDVGSESGEKAE